VSLAGTIELGICVHVSIVRTRILLRNPRDSALEPVVVDAVVETGSMHLCIPEHVALQPGLETLEEREVAIADGGRRVCRYVGPV
jgi:hypothetical protein